MLIHIVHIISMNYADSTELVISLI